MWIATVQLGYQVRIYTRFFVMLSCTPAHEPYDGDDGAQ